MRSRSQLIGLLIIGAFVAPRCNCEDALTMIDEPQPETDAEPRIALDAGRVELEPDASELDAAASEPAPDASELDAGEPITDPCAMLQRQTLQRSFSFPNMGPCPWGQGDNSPLETAIGWSARTEQLETITDLPAQAIICNAAFEIPQTQMYFDDAMVIALENVILMTDVNISVFQNDGSFYLYDWTALRGTRGSNLYCLENCTLPPMETPGEMSLSISSALAQAIGERAATPGVYEIRVVTIGDNDFNDCRHEPFDFIITLEYVVP